MFFAIFIAVAAGVGFGMHHFGFIDASLIQIKYQLNMLQSRSLPYPPETFVGRERELNELVESLSFSHHEHRVVNIVGPPGIGKTTLAIHVGQKIVAAGVVVHYINVAEFPDELVQQVLAEKVLKSAEIITDKAGDFERLLRWARECSYYNLLILDNCDDVLNYQKEKFQTAVQKIVETSPKVKVLMTSREISITLNYMKQHKTSELSMESACDLLAKKVPVEANLTAEGREKIAELTGKIPLALQIIASLLSMSIPPSPEEIISELEKEPIKTLSHDAVPEDSKVNVSFSLSYKYLNIILKKIASYIAYFPGSFSKEAAIFSVVDLMHGSSHEGREEIITRALRSLLERSLLEYDKRTKRYLYHRLIREFFRIKNVNHGNKLESFLSGFNRYFSNKLYEFAGAFHTHHERSLSFLDTERHNIQLLLDNLAGQNIKLQDDFLTAITALSLSLDLKFLTCRFTSEELLGPVSGSLTYLDKHIKQYIKQINPSPMESDCIYQPKISVTVSRMICTYELLIRHLSNIENQLHGHEVAARVYGDRKDIMEDIKPNITSKHVYINFLKQLAHYYHLLGLNDAEIDCHRRILEYSGDITGKCKFEKCRYDDTAKLYVVMGDYQEAAHLYELSLSKEQHNDVMKKVEIIYDLLWIYDQLSLKDKVNDFFEKLNSMQEEIMSIPSSQIFMHHSIVMNIIHLYGQNSLYRPKYAHKLGMKLFESLSVIGPVDKFDEEKLMTAVRLVKSMFRDRYYKETIELGEQILKQNVIDSVRLALQTLIGRAKIHIYGYFSSSVSAGLDDLETVFDDPSTDKETRAKLCWYLIFRPINHFSSCSPVNLHPFELLRKIWLILFKTVPPRNSEYRMPLVYSTTIKPKEQLGTLNDQHDISIVGKRLNLWEEISTHFQFIVSVKQLVQYYLFRLTEFCINSNILRIVINIISVVIRLWIFHKICMFIWKCNCFNSEDVQELCFMLAPIVCILALFLGPALLILYIRYLQVLSI